MQTIWMRHAVRGLPAASVLVALLRFMGGGFRGVAAVSAADLVVGLLLLTGVGLSAWGRLRAEMPGLRSELELGAGLLASAYVLVGLGGPALWPVVCLLMASLVAFSSRTAGVSLLAVALTFDGITTLSVPGAGVSAFAAHAAFLALFSALYHLVLSARLVLARKEETDAVKNRLREVEERARSYRLANSGVSEAAAVEKDQEKWLHASVKEIERAVGAALEIAEVALQSQTCAAFLLSEDGKSLRLHDCRSTSDKVQRERMAAGEGVLGGVLKSGAPLRMAGKAVRGVTHYEGGGPVVKALLAVPIREPSGQVRGVLVADRAEEKPFGAGDERVLSAVAGEVWRAIEVERVMGFIRKGRDEKDRFYRAIEEMNRAGSPDEVFLAVLESVRQLAAVDFVAVTVVSEEDGKRTHKVVRTSGVTNSGRALEGRTFGDNTGLVANVVRYGAPLPGRDVRDMDRQVIFDTESEIRGLAGLKIFPLLAGDRILGTLVAGSRKRGVLDSDVLRMLEVMALQAGQAVLRAQLFEQMERMATTDGLTGLLNHRTFQQRADEILAQSRRYGRKASLILTDIDHFKSVNDTYGHPMGDQVLKGVARIVREQARDTDVVARYGGEEFAIVMPETDTRGALIIAERIREAVMAATFQTESGPLKVTLSLGIATTPDHAAEKQGLVDLSDQCLYYAKRHGRNQAVTVDKLQGAQQELHVAGT